MTAWSWDWNGDNEFCKCSHSAYWHHDNNQPEPFACSQCDCAGFDSPERTAE